jgi:hypothetical protein
MLVAHEDPLAGPPHAVHDIMLFEALEARKNGGVFFRLGFFRAKGVVRERVKADCFGLVAIERLGENRRVGGLESDRGDGRHFGAGIGPSLGGGIWGLLMSSFRELRATAAESVRTFPFSQGGESLGLGSTAHHAATKTDEINKFPGLDEMLYSRHSL